MEGLYPTDWTRRLLTIFDVRDPEACDRFHRERVAWAESAYVEALDKHHYVLIVLPGQRSVVPSFAEMYGLLGHRECRVSSETWYEWSMRQMASDVLAFSAYLVHYGAYFYVKSLERYKVVCGGSAADEVDEEISLICSDESDWQ